MDAKSDTRTAAGSAALAQTTTYAVYAAVNSSNFEHSIHRIISFAAESLTAFLMGVPEDFELAAAAAKELPESVSNEDKLALYGLFKQSTVGNVNTGDVSVDLPDEYVTHRMP